MKIKFAKLENGSLTPAPNPLYLGDRLICNPRREDYAPLGWLPVVRTDPPELPEESTDMTVAHWEVQNGEIRQVWKIMPIPEPEPPKPAEPTLEERVTRNEIKTDENRGMIEAIANGYTESPIPEIPPEEVLA